MNESLAIRKFKQNIHDREIRIMALTTEHTSLAEAIAHATEKKSNFNHRTFRKKRANQTQSKISLRKRAMAMATATKMVIKSEQKRIALSAYKPFFRSMLFQKQNPFGAQKRE